jgi:(p)ppGpp synthase/HD superfamily hydrolase
MLTRRFADAFALAEKLHRRQTRKGMDVPYISHLMAVSGLVLEHGGDEDEAISGLLHDAVEDQGGLATARVISDQFGPAVAQIVLGCSDAVDEPGKPKLPWRERKAAFIARAGSLPRSTALVVTCDKLHNLRCLIADIEREGPSTLSRFTSPAGVSWYYAGLAEALTPFSGRAPVGDLKRLVARFATLVEGYDLPRGALDG